MFFVSSEGEELFQFDKKLDPDQVLDYLKRKVFDN
jgi:hypothetical protein